MAGKTPAKAVRAFTSPIQSALTCFADGRVQVDSYNPAVEGVLQFNGGDAVKLNGSSRIHIFVSMRYQIVSRVSINSRGKYTQQAGRTPCWIGTKTPSSIFTGTLN